MTSNQTTATTKPRPRRSVKKVVPDHVEKVQKIADVTQQQVIEVIAETKENLNALETEKNQLIQKKVNGFKEDILLQLDRFKNQINISHEDFLELKQFVKSELHVLIDEFTKMGKALKTDVNDISTKHKMHLTDTFKRSKDHTLEVWHKVYTKQ